MDKKPVDAKKFAQEMRRAVNSSDVEVSHFEMDELMCKKLRSLGYDEAVDIFEKAQKWYA